MGLGWGLWKHGIWIVKVTGNVSFFGTVWDGPWFIWLVSGYVQWFSATDVGVNLAMDGNWTYGWSRSQGLSLILLNNFGMDLG